MLFIQRSLHLRYYQLQPLQNQLFSCVKLLVNFQIFVLERPGGVTWQVPDIYAERVVVSSQIFEAKSQGYQVLFGGGVLCIKVTRKVSWYQNTPHFSTNPCQPTYLIINNIREMLKSAVNEVFLL